MVRAAYGGDGGVTVCVTGVFAVRGVGTAHSRCFAGTFEPSQREQEFRFSKWLPACCGSPAIHPPSADRLMVRNNALELPWALLIRCR